MCVTEILSGRSSSQERELCRSSFLLYTWKCSHGNREIYLYDEVRNMLIIL